MKKLLLLFCALVTAGVLLSGCFAISPILNALGGKKSKEASSQSVESRVTQSDAAASEKTDGVQYDGKYKDLKRVGNEEMGYVSIPSSWRVFDDLDVARQLFQYGDTTGKSVLTMENYDNSLLSAEDFASDCARRMEAEDVENLTTAKVKIGGYDAFQVYGLYSDGIVLVAWYFETEKYVQYVAIESGLEEIVDLVDLVEKTYSYTDKELGTSAGAASGSGSSTKMQRVGTDKMGYVDVPSDWVSVEPQYDKVEYIQYNSADGLTTLKLSVLEVGNASLEEVAVTIFQQQAQANGEDTAEAKIVTMGGNEAYKGFIYDQKTETRMGYWVFQTEEKTTHFIILTGVLTPNIDEMINTVEKTFSFTK